MSGVSDDSEKKLMELFDQARRIRRREKLALKGYRNDIYAWMCPAITYKDRLIELPVIIILL